MILVDTSVWVSILRDKTGTAVKTFHRSVGEDIYVLCRFTQLELLQGARDEQEFQRLEEYLSTQYYLEAREHTWKEAARIFFDLRRKGITLTSPIDCCIAQIAMESDALLLHQDQDFEKIARIRPLTAERFNPDEQKRQ